MSEVKTAELVKFDSGLGEEKQNAIAARYNTATGNLSEEIEAAKAITIADASDRKGMKKARDARLGLRRIRLDVEKARKDLKEDALRESKAIDGMANVIKFLIEPVENDLQKKEDFAKRIEEERVARIAAERGEELAGFGIDTAHFNLAGMTVEAYDELKRTSEAGYKARIAEEERERQRIEDQRKAEAETEAMRKEEARVEAERLQAENEELRKKAEAADAERAKAEKAAEATRKKAEAEKRKAEEAAEEIRQKAQEDADKAAKDAEDARRKAKDEELRKAKETEEKAQADRDAEQVRLAAPDKEKVAAFVAELCGTKIPNVSSDAGLALFARVRSALNDIVTDCRTTAKEMEGGE